jgi:hypothetical protein
MASTSAGLSLVTEPDAAAVRPVAICLQTDPKVSRLASLSLLPPYRLPWQLYYTAPCGKG